MTSSSNQDPPQRLDLITSILLTNLPIPPSSNNMYYLLRRKNKTYHIPSSELKNFKKQMQCMPLTAAYTYLDAQKKATGWVKMGLELEIRCIFFFHKSKLYTKQGKPKKMDVSNRIKALHDSLSELLGVDDCNYFKISAEKAECHDNLREMVCVEISPCNTHPGSKQVLLLPG